MNPLIERYRNSHRHGRTYGVLSGLYLVTLVLAAIVALPKNASLDFGVDAWWVPEFATKLYSELWLLQTGLWFWTIGTTAGIIPKEIERKSYDLFRLLPLPSHQKAFGLMAGANLPLLVFIAVDLIVATLIQPISSISFGYHVQLQAITVSAGVLLNGVALLMSVWSPVRASGSSMMIRRSVMFLGLLVAIAPLISIASTIGSIGSRYERVHIDLAHRVLFFGLSTPVSVVIFCALWFFIAWAYGATLRRLRCEDQAPFSRLGSIAFLSSFCVFMLGVTVPNEPFVVFDQWSNLIGPVWLVLLIAMHGAREQPGSIRPGVAWSPFFNLVTAAQLALVACAFTITSALLLGVDTRYPSAVVPVGLVTYAFITLMIEITSLLRSTFRHAVLVGGFVVFVYALFPALASGTTRKAAYIFSGFDYFVVLLSAGSWPTLEHLSTALAINGVYCVALSLVMIKLWMKSQRPRPS